MQEAVRERAVELALEFTRGEDAAKRATENNAYRQVQLLHSELEASQVARKGKKFPAAAWGIWNLFVPLQAFEVS